MEDNKITLLDEDGVERVFELVISFDIEDKTYVLLACLLYTSFTFCSRKKGWGFKPESFCTPICRKGALTGFWKLPALPRKPSVILFQDSALKP